MSMQYKKPVNDTKLFELASNYSIVNIAKGKIGMFRNLETRLKVISYMAPKSQFVEIDKAYDIVSEKIKSYYWRQVAKQAGRDVDKCSGMAKISLQNELVPYPQKREVSEYQGKETVGSKKCRNRLATLALLAAMGFSFLTGIAVQGHSDRRIIREKEQRIEQLVRESEKPSMAILTDLSSEEIDKRYEKYAADEKAGRLPVLDLTQNKEDGVEYYTNRLNNKGVFVKGFMYSTNKMQVPAEFDEQELKERAEAKARYAKHVEKAREHILAIPRTGVDMVSDTVKTVKNMSIASYNLTTSLFADKIKRKEKLHDAVDYLKKGLREAVSVFEAPSQIVLEVPTALTYVAGTTPLNFNNYTNKGLSETGKFLEETIEEMPERKGKFVKIWEWGREDGFLKSTFATPRDFGKSTIALGTNWFSFKYIWANIIDWFKQNIFGYDNGKLAGTSSVAGGMGRGGGAGTP